MNFDNLSILVSTFDKYAVCWEPFCHGLKKYWPDHPHIYFITNELDAPMGKSIKVGADHGWAGNLKYALDQLDTDFILYSQEDYWIQNSVDSLMISDYLDLLRSNHADYVRLYPAPPPDLPLPGYDRLGIISNGSHYRTSLQMALWRKETLLSLLCINETPWQFEVKGSIRSSQPNYRFLCVTKRRYGVDYVFTAVVNGYWSKKAYEYAEKEGLSIPFDHLPKKTIYKRIQDSLVSFAYRLKKHGARNK